MNHLFAARLLTFVAVVAAGLVFIAPTTIAQDRPYDTSELKAFKLVPALAQWDVPQGITDAEGRFSKAQIEDFVCNTRGNPTDVVVMSCATTEYGQDYAPDNEIAIAVNPNDPNHLVAGSNDYYYRFNNSTGARQALVLTGFFTSFDGGATWLDGQIPLRSGNGAGDPAPAFDAKHGMVLMAQLENAGGQGGFFVSQGDVSVSRSADGGLTWSEPVTVMQGTGAGIGPANNAVFWDKGWITVDNNPDSAFYGRAYLTATRFLNGLHGSYAESPIYLSYSDDGGASWSEPKEISGSHPSCTYQETGGGTDCDEDQFSYPEVAADGTLYVHFANSQNEAEWEVAFDFDSQLMVVQSTDGGETFGQPVPAVQLEDGLSDMPFSVIQRQTVWGHQIRWNAMGNITANPTNANHLVIVFADRGTPNPNATEGCFYTLPGDPPEYDPCGAGPGSDTNVYKVESFDGGASWSARKVVKTMAGHGWFPWADFTPDGKLVVAWDQDDGAAPVETYHHVLKVGGGKVEQLGGPESINDSVTHWAGQYTPNFPNCGKNCNVFHGDYTGLAVGADGSINVVWTGLNTATESPQIDSFTGLPHTGYRQDAMFARR